MCKTSALLAIALLSTFAVTSSYAQQPPDPTNSDARGNTAGGTNALLNLTSSGIDNTAFGWLALKANTSGIYNVALGAQALLSNTTGDENTALGQNTLTSNINGWENTAVGSQVLMDLTSGLDNVSVGFESQNSVVSGSSNVSVGDYALTSSTGSNNTALGTQAGDLLTTGSYNIDIGNEGKAGESQIIRIGTAASGTTGQNQAYIAGIYGSSVISGSTVIIGSTGKLGTVVSSARYKQDIADMGDASTKLLSLRPVTFSYKADPDHSRQYGLVAEEVAKVYPDLVVRNEKGEVDSIQYHELAPMLLNELKKESAELASEKEELAKERAELVELRAAIKSQAATLTRLEATAAQPMTVASR